MDNELKDFWKNKDFKENDFKEKKEIKRPIQHKNEDINLNLNFSEDKDNTTFKFLIIQIAFNIILFGLVMFKMEHNTATIIGALLWFNLFAVWLYSFINILTHDFIKEQNKTIWLIVIILIPISCFAYPDISKNQIEIH